MISSTPDTLGSTIRVIFLALFGRPHDSRDECLVTNRGKYYGLPAIVLDRQVPTVDDLRSVTREIGHLSIGHCEFQKITEFTGDWDGRSALFVIFTAKDVIVLSRLGQGKLVVPEFNPGIGLPDVSIERLCDARKHLAHSQSVVAA
jgi:hypothetical protein